MYREILLIRIMITALSVKYKVCTASTALLVFRPFPEYICLLAELIYYLIRENGALCLSLSSFFLTFRICRPLNDGSLHPVLPRVILSECVLLSWGWGRCTRLLKASHPPDSNQFCPFRKELMFAVSCCCSGDARLHRFLSRWRSDAGGAGDEGKGA